MRCVFVVVNQFRLPSRAIIPSNYLFVVVFRPCLTECGRSVHERKEQRKLERINNTHMSQVYVLFLRTEYPVLVDAKKKQQTT